MRRKKVAIIAGSVPNYPLLAFKYFILSLNQHQDFYEFTFPDIDEHWLNSKEYVQEDLMAKFAYRITKTDINADSYIAIISGSISGNMFFMTAGNLAIITTDVWEKYFSPPSLFEYLLHCIGANLLYMHPDLNVDSHLDTRGCVIDYTRIKADDQVDIALGYICDEHREEIKESVGTEYLTQFQKIISRKWIGSTTERDSVAYNLKHFFRFDLEKDSGFNKTFWERAVSTFDELPKEGVKIFMEAIKALILAGILLYLGLKE